jgi:hypothetical protein
METFWADPTARNSKRDPPYGKGEVLEWKNLGSSEIKGLLGGHILALGSLHECLEVFRHI